MFRFLGRGVLHRGVGLGLSVQCCVQSRHRGANGLGVGAGVCSVQCLGGFQHHAITVAQRSSGLFALQRLAVEGVVNGLAEAVPQLLLELALQRNALGLGLPAVLQRLDGVDVQHRCIAQRLRFLHHGLAHHHALLLCSFQRRGGQVEGFLPQRLQFGVHFFADMAGIAPAVRELVQCAVETFPVVRLGAFLVALGPGLELLDQRQALLAVLCRFGLDFLQPDFDHLVRFVAGVVEALPQRVVGGAALVGLLPVLAQRTQGLLHLAPAQRLTVRALQQGLGLGDEFFAQLVSAPALPALQFAGSGQGGMGLVLQRVIDQTTMLLQGVAHRGRSADAGLAVAQRDLVLQFQQRITHDLCGLGTHFGVNGGLGRFGHGLGRQATRLAQFVGPDRHRRQRCCSVGSSGYGLADGGGKCVPDHQKLCLGRVELGREFGVYARPQGIPDQVGGLCLPVLDVTAQHVEGGAGIAPGLGGQHFDALRQQHCRFALYLDAVLQIFNALDALAQALLEQGQRFAAQRSAGLGRVALPGQGVSNVQARQVQQRIGARGPFHGQRFLALGALDLVELFAQRLGRAFVTRLQFLEHLLHLLLAGLGGKPVADARGALTRGRCGESAMGQFVEREGVGGFGGS